MSFKYHDLSLDNRRYRRRSAGWVGPYLAGLASGVILVAVLLL